MVVILLIVLLAQQQVTTVQTEKDTMDAQNSLLDLSAAARAVYAQGEGSKKLVFIRLPSSYDPDQSSVGNKSISIRAAGTDHVSVENFNVRGSLPGKSGGQWVWVISEGNRVRIGTAMLGLSRNSISIVMAPGDSDSVSFYAESLWERNITVSTALTWPPSADVSATPHVVGGPLLSLGDKMNVTMDFQAGSNSSGPYSGELTFTSSDGNVSETISVPITVTVMSYGLDTSPPLNITPDFWAATLQPTNSTSQVFTICTNAHTSLSGVTFTPSSGEPGNWVNDTGSLGPMGAGTCQLKTMSLTVPNGTAAGTYGGSIELVGQGAIGARDTISMFITVSSNESSGGGCEPGLNNMTLCNCPVGSLYSDIPVCMCRPADIYVLNNTIHGGPDDGLPYNHTLRSGTGTTTLVIAGTEDPDNIIGAPGTDIICGHGGDDNISGGNGPDMLDGGPGDDILYGDNADDTIYGKEGDDKIYGGQGNDKIDGGDGNDFLYGDDHDDLIYGGPGNDVIDGDTGKNTMCGNADDDNITTSGGSDILDGGTGTNTLNGADEKTSDCYRGTYVTNCTEESGYYSTCGPS